MAVAFRAAGAAYNGTTTAAGQSYPIPVPAGVTAGDVVLVFITAPSSVKPTPAAGFTEVVSSGRTTVWSKVATASEGSSYTFLSGAGGTTSGFAVAYSGAAHPVHASAGATQTDAVSSVIAPSVTTTLPGRVVFAFAQATGSTLTVPETLTARATTSTGVALAIGDQAFTTGATGTRTATSNNTTQPRTGLSVSLVQPNTAPNAPTLIAPLSTTVDRAVTQRFSWSFSDPDSGDSQSKYDLRYRLVGAATWTDTTGTTPNQFVDFAGGTFPAGDYEWQVRTYDALGLVGPYSASGFFTAASTPATPTITAPVNNSTLSANSATVTWSAPSQDAYQLRTVADAAGSPNAAVVYSDTGTVTDTTSRGRLVGFPTNNRVEHVQVRVRVGGLWSSWASVKVTVAFTAPATPTVAALGDDASATITVVIGNPVPTGGQPTVGSNDLYVRCDATNPTADPYRPFTERGVRIGTGLANNATYVDGRDGQGAPASGVAYEYRAVAVATTGATATSAWTA